MNLKSFFVAILISINSFAGFGQDHYCGQHIVTQQLFKSNELFKEKYLNTVVKTLEGIEKSHFQKTENRNPIKYTIPVVFHVLHDNGPENISNEQIYDQIRILNRDYQKQNSDTAKVVNAFKNNIANVGFEFVLAKTDPKGQCTSGINRYRTQKTNWDANKLEDFIYSWPTDQYLNIYIVKKINIAPAYTFLPGTPIPANADAVVCESIYVGSIGTATFDSRAITHEVGHWFGLPHIWGISNALGVACGDDFVADTPITKGFTTCTPSSAKICNPNIDENYQNYMDYSPCKYMFTNGQAAYMSQTIESNISGRQNLVSEQNLISTGIISSQACLPIANFDISASSICKGEKIKFTSFSNTGSDQTTLLWQIIGPDTLIAHDSILETTFLLAGSYEAKLVVTGPNGMDSLSKIIIVHDGANGKVPTQLFSFDNESQFYEFDRYNLDNDNIVWKYEGGFGADSTKGCLALENLNSEVSGARHYFETPFYNFANTAKPQMSFFYSFARISDNQNDSFKIEYTLDCGSTWKPINLQLSTLNMANNSGGFSGDYFIPTKPEHWKKLTISSYLYPLVRYKPSVKFRFYFKSDTELGISNNLYIDELRIWDGAITSISDWKNNVNISVAPNPSTSIIEAKIPLNISEIAHFFIKDITGKMVESNIILTPYSDEILFTLNGDNQLKTGLYQFLVFTKDGKSSVARFTIL